MSVSSSPPPLEDSEHAFPQELPQGGNFWTVPSDWQGYTLQNGVFNLTKNENPSKSHASD